ncbi:MAG: hypothetical protein ABJH68_11385 [Ilumatobacter sp.]
MTPLERLRLATALVHTIPDADLRLRTDDGELIVVTHEAGADIDPCKMRRLVAAMACPDRPDLANHITEVSLGGGLTDLGGGVFGSSSPDGVHRWLASLLGFATLSELLDGVDLDALPDHAMHACLKPDPALGVTVVGITSNDARFDHALDETAAQVAAACFVAELCGSATSARHAGDRIGGVS